VARNRLSNAASSRGLPCDEALEALIHLLLLSGEHEDDNEHDIRFEPEYEDEFEEG
jgi:hypothetical protein